MRKSIMFLLLLFSIFIIGCSNEKTITEKETEDNVKTPTIVETQNKMYEVNYDLDGGECETLVYSFKEGEPFTLPIPHKNGYTFLGWYENNLKVDSLLNKNYFLKAKWEINKYTIKIFNEEELLDTFEVEHGESFNKEILNKYILKGLQFVSADKEIDVVEKDAEIHCIFEVVNNAIVFLYSDNKITCKVVNPDFIGILITFEGDSNFEFESNVSKSSVKVNDRVGKFIYTQDKNVTKTQDLFVLNNEIELSNINIESYVYSGEDILFVDASYFVIK